MLRSNGNPIVDITSRQDVSALTMRRTTAVDARIGDTGLRIDFCAKNPDHRPHCSLGAQSRRSVAKGECGVQIGEAVPLNGKEYGLRWVDLEPSIPSTEITFEHADLSARIEAATPFDEANDSGSRGEEQFPGGTTMHVGGDEGIDTFAQLTAIGDGSANGDLRGCAKGTTKNRTRKFILGERSDEGSMLEFRCNVVVHVLWSEVR